MVRGPQTRRRGLRSPEDRGTAVVNRAAPWTRSSRRCGRTCHGRGAVDDRDVHVAALVGQFGVFTFVGAGVLSSFVRGTQRPGVGTRFPSARSCARARRWDMFMLEDALRAGTTRWLRYDIMISDRRVTLGKVLFGRGPSVMQWAELTTGRRRRCRFGGGRLALKELLLTGSSWPRSQPPVASSAQAGGDGRLARLRAPQTGGAVCARIEASIRPSEHHRPNETGAETARSRLGMAISKNWIFRKMAHRASDRGVSRSTSKA